MGLGEIFGGGGAGMKEIIYWEGGGGGGEGIGVGKAKFISKRECKNWKVVSENSQNKCITKDIHDNAVKKKI